MIRNMLNKPAIALGACLCFAALGCIGENVAHTASEPLADRSISVQVAAVQKVQVERAVETVATLLPQETVTLSAEVEGPVDRVHVDLGDCVTKGEVLVEINQDKLRFERDQNKAALLQVLNRLGISEEQLDSVDPLQVSSVKKAEADLENAKTEAERNERLFAEGVVAQQTLDQNRTRLKMAQAAYDLAVDEARSLKSEAIARRAALSLAQKQFADALVHSPLDGYVSEKRVSQGEYVRVGTPLFQLVDLDPVKVRAVVPERFAGVVRPDQPIRATVEAHAGCTFEGKLVRVSPIVKAETRTFEVEAELPNPDGALKPGSFAKLCIITKEQDMALAVPEDAIVYFAGITKVFSVQDGKAVGKAVETGLKLKGLVEITKGIQEQDVVAVSNLSQLEDGIPVKVETQQG